jgi:hypothetical protein
LQNKDGGFFKIRIVWHPKFSRRSISLRHLFLTPNFVVDLHLFGESFWNARSLLEEGLSWRVGDGKRIGIWTNKWVLAAPSEYLQSLVGVLDRNAKVCELLNTDTNWWNTSLIYEIFTVEEA